MRKGKVKKTKQIYPAKKGFFIRARYYSLCVLFPVVLLCAAFYCAAGLFLDIQILNLGMDESLAMQGAGLGVFAAAAAFCLWLTLKYGTVDGFYQAANSRTFKKETYRILSEITQNYEIVFCDNEKGKHSKTFKNLNYCLEKIKAHKKFFKTYGAETKREEAIYEETVKLKEIMGANVFSQAKFDDSLQRLYSCINERFILPVKAYKGTGDYAFVSYSHKDTKPVIDAIRKLQDAGINIWYDEGITEGHDWMNHIARKIDKCSHFIMFQTASYAKSIHCNVETKRAIKNGRTIIRVILSKGKMSEGIEMYLETLQSIDFRNTGENKVERLIEMLKNRPEPEPARVNVKVNNKEFNDSPNVFFDII